MSYASFTKSFPNLLKGFSQTLFQPTGIAVMASVGIHAALGVSLPYLPISSQEKPSSRTVQLVQLSPTEQSRLPQLTPPPLSNQLGSLYPLPPGLSTPYPPLSSLGSSSFYSNLPPISPEIPRRLARTTQTQTQTGAQQKASTPQKPSTTQKPQPTDKNQSVYQGAVPIPQPARRGIPAGLTPGQLPYTPPSFLYPPSNGDQPVVKPNTRLPAPPNNSSQQIAPGLPSTSSLQPADPNQVVKQPQPSNSTGALSGNPSSTQPSPPNMSATATPPGTPVATATPPQAPAPSNPNGTDNGSGSNDDKKVRDGLTSLAANQNIVEDYKKHDSIIGNYPPEACAAKLDGKSYIEAIVDKQGKFVSVHPAPPSNSTFDNVAISTVRAMPFGATGKTVSHLVPVVFEYDSKVCPSSTTSQRSEQPQNAPTPPQDAPAPKKSPETQNAPTPPQDAPAPKKSPDR